MLGCFYGLSLACITEIEQASSMPILNSSERLLTNRGAVEAEAKVKQQVVVSHLIARFVAIEISDAFGLLRCPSAMRVARRARGHTFTHDVRIRQIERLTADSDDMPLPEQERHCKTTERCGCR